MIYAHLALLSHLVFIPGFYDGHAPAKLLFILGLSVYALLESAPRMPWRDLPLFWPIIAFLGISLLSLGNVINWHLYIERMSLHVSGFVLFWIVASVKPSAKQINRVALMAFIVVAIMWLSELLVPEEKGVMGNLSFNSIATIQLAWFIGFAVFHKTESYWWAGLLLAPLLMLSFQSDAAILTVVAVWGVAVVCVYVWKDLNMLFAASPAVLVIATMVLLITPTSNKLQQRVAGWKNTMVMSGYLGIGSGQFEIRYPEYASAVVRDPEIDILLDYAHDKATEGLPTRMQISRHPHNEYLLLLAEYGLFGMVAYCFLLSLLLYSRQSHDYLSIGLGLSLIATLVLSVFWFPLTHPSMAASFWVMAGMYVGYQKT